MVDLNHFLDRLARNPVSRGRPRVRGDDDAALKAKSQGRGAVGEFDRTVRVGVVVGVCAEKGRGL